MQLQYSPILGLKKSKQKLQKYLKRCSQMKNDIDTLKKIANSLQDAELSETLIILANSMAKHLKT